MAHGSEHITPKRIAIIGGGVSGIACSWRLRNEDTDTYIFEASSRLGGHANAVPFRGRHGDFMTVDTAFVTFNEQSYPMFSAFVKALNVPTIPTDMSFGVSEDDGKIEWASCSAWSFVNTFLNLFKLWFWRLLFDVIRFNLFATDILTEEKDSSCGDDHDPKARLLTRETQKLESIGQYLSRMGYSEQFKRYYIIPMLSAPWCIDPEDLARDFPAAPLIHFMSQHHLLSTVTRTLRWKTFKNGSITYINAFRDSVNQRQHINLNCPVSSVQRHPDGRLRIIKADNSAEVFDHVVFAVHASQALSMLGESATKMEKDILSKFKTSRNECVLHSDTSLLPSKPLSCASWNCLMYSHDTRKVEHKDYYSPDKEKSKEQQGNTGKISITFDMNRLQGIPYPSENDSPGRVLVSMNPIRPPRMAQSVHVYHTPTFTSDSVMAARAIHTINGVSGVSFAGAWMGYGFHEDGFASGTQVADALINGRERTQHKAYGNLLPAARVHHSPLQKIARSIVELVQQTFVDRNPRTGGDDL